MKPLDLYVRKITLSTNGVRTTAYPHTKKMKLDSTSRNIQKLTQWITDLNVGNKT